MPAPRHRRNTVRLTNHVHAAVVLLAVSGLALSWLQAPSPARPRDVQSKASAPTARHASSGAESPDRATSDPDRAQPEPPRLQETRAPVHRRGADIGWPQCPPHVGYGGRNGLGQPMPDPRVTFVIVGLTNGRAFTPNPCLAMHLRWVRTHHVFASAYAFAAYPSRGQLRRFRSQGPFDGGQQLGALKNAGHAAALYNVRVMRRHGFVTPHVWLDVEPSSSRPWSHRPRLNRAVVRGWIRGYRDAGYTVGFYSTQNLWRPILGRLRLGLPEWRTAGPASPRAALQKCNSGSFQGGRAVIAQWWTKRRDFDRICPGRSLRKTLARYFHQW